MYGLLENNDQLSEVRESPKVCMISRPSNSDDTDVPIEVVMQGLRNDIKDLKKSLDAYNGRMVHIEHKAVSFSDDVDWMKQAHLSLVHEIESIKMNQKT